MKCNLENFVSNYPSEEHATAGRRPAVARSAFTVFRVKKKVPYMDQNEKKIFPFLNLALASNKRSTMEKKYAP